MASAARQCSPSGAAEQRSPADENWAHAAEIQVQELFETWTSQDHPFQLTSEPSAIPLPSNRNSAKEVAEFFKSLQSLREEEGDRVENVERGPLFMKAGTLSFKDVSFSVEGKDPAGGKKKHVILAPCSGHIEAGKLVAVMGPSGSGKSTLLDILADKKTSAYEGTVYLNGHTRDKYFPLVTSYVPQQDVMPAHWLVREAVFFDARLRTNLPTNLTDEIVLKYVDNLLASLGLANVANTKVGSANVRGISGGQRRRVTLARGMASGASILFCDEPTSGLSSTDAEVCIRVLKQTVLRSGMTTLVVIHQPRAEVVDLFDELLLLTAEPGRVVYQGPIEGAQAHYAAVGYPVPTGVNCADWYLDLVSPSFKGQQIDAFVAYYARHVAPLKEKEVEQTLGCAGPTSEEVIQMRFDQLSAFGPVRRRVVRSKGPTMQATPFYRQLRLVAGRALTLMRRDIKSLISELLVACFKGFIVGLAFLDVGNLGTGQNQASYVYMMLQMAALSSMPKVAQLVDERTVMKMEVSEHLYSEGAYIVTSFILSTAVTFATNSAFTIISYAMTSLEWRFFGELFGWQMIFVLVMDSLFLFFASVGKSAKIGQQTALPLLIFFVQFNGFFTTLASVPDGLKWAIYSSPFFWTMQPITCSTFSDGVLPSDDGYTSSGQFVVDSLEFRCDQSSVSFAVLFGFVAFFRTLQVIALKRCNNIDK